MEKRMVDPFELASEITGKTLPGILLTTKAGNKVNSMAIGWGHIGVLWNMPVYICFVRKSRFTYEMLEANPEFTVNTHTGERLRPDILKICGSTSGRDHDKVSELGLTLVEPEVVSVPAILEAPITLECKILMSQLMDFSAIPKEVQERFYPGNDGSSARPGCDTHVMYFGKIVSSYVIE